jgi:predicted RNase H-like HicB family nuclease
MDAQSILTQRFLHIKLWQEEGAYIAECLDIPGCISDGATREEALANVHEAISGCLQMFREQGWTPNQSPIELIEQPIEDFVQVPVH